MSMLAATTTVAALLIANPSASDVDRIAANGGFLVGNAHRCGIAEARVVRAGQVVHDLIVAAAQDSKAQEDATMRFAEFFVVSAFPDPADKQPIASCKVVASELTQLEQHSATGVNPPTGDTVGPQASAGDGE